MFTVKVCEGRADETIFEAVLVRKVITQGTAPDIGQIHIDCTDGSKLSYPIFAESSEDHPRLIYVMNRYGATVAKYDL